MQETTGKKRRRGDGVFRLKKDIVLLASLPVATADEVEVGVVPRYEF